MNDDGFVVELVLIGVLILLNGFFAGSELAVVSARRARLRSRADAGHRGAAAALRLKDDPDRFLATVQVGVTVVGTLASAVGGVAAAERFEPMFASMVGPAFAEPVAVAVVVAVIAYLSLVVGELVPKAVAVRNADALAVRVAWLIERLSGAARPLVAVLTGSSRVVLRVLGQRDVGGSPFHTVDDLRAMVEEAGRQGVIEPALLRGAIEFQDREVREVMTPRVRMATIRAGTSLDVAARFALETGHTRLPVVSGDEVLGVVWARDLLAAVVLGKHQDLASLIHEIAMVPPSKSAAELLQEMRAARRPIALVVDEHGSVAGLVTMEDLLEVIVGEIDDERDEAVPRVERRDGMWEIDGAMPVHELRSEHGIALDESPEYVTLAGLVLARLGRLAAAGDRVEASGYELHVMSLDRHRISRVRVVDRRPEPGTGGEPIGAAGSKQQT